MARFQTKIRQARFSLSPFSAQQMLALAEGLQATVSARISAGLNVDDQPAKPLKPGYLKIKQRKGGTPVRDWKLTGRTLRSMKVLTVSQNRAIIGFTDPVSQQRAFFNNRRERQFGVSPRDREALVAAVKAMARGAVSVKKVA